MMMFTRMMITRMMISSMITRKESKPMTVLDMSDVSPQRKREDDDDDDEDDNY